jgi:hypothetical protein
MTNVAYLCELPAVSTTAQRLAIDGPPAAARGALLRRFATPPHHDAAAPLSAAMPPRLVAAALPQASTPRAATVFTRGIAGARATGSPPPRWKSSGATPAPRSPRSS